MRIALVNPMARHTAGYHTIGSRIPHLGLQVLAQRTPAGHEVEVIDEIFGQDSTERLLSERGYDLVGITSFTSNAPRAYELARFCRRRGMATIFGGPHAWARPDEAQEHFDSVAVGECDAIWPDIVADAAAGRLARRYEGHLAALESGIGRADQSLQAINGRYDISSIQTSRGCPCGCEYCSVTLFNGANVRRRPIDEIIDEWNATPRRFMFVVDDNFFGVSKSDAEWAKELLREIIRRGRKRLWFSQTTINMGADAEGLRLAYKAGCRGMLVGIESFNIENLKRFGKGINKRLVESYADLVDGFHRGGIAVFGAFIVGADEDTPETVAETALHAVKLGVDIIQITNLTPLPGTRMFDRWMREGRILATKFPDDWQRYTFIETVYQPSKMSSRELDEAIYELRHLAAHEPWVWKRTLRTLWRTKSISTALFVHGVNNGFARIARALMPAETKRFGPVKPSERLEILRQSFAM